MAKKHKKRVPDYSEIRHAEEAAKMKPAAAADGRPAAAAGAAGDNRPPYILTPVLEVLTSQEI